MPGRKLIERQRKPSDLDRVLTEIKIVALAVDRGTAEQQETNRLLGALGTPAARACQNTIHVVAVELKPQEITMPPVDHAPDLILPASTLRAKLSISNPRKPDGTRATGLTWTSSDESQVSIQPIPDANVQVADPAWTDPGDGTVAPLIDEVDAADGQPNIVYSTYGNTPLDAGEATVTAKAAGMTDSDIKVKYADPELGHMPIFGAEAAEE